MRGTVAKNLRRLAFVQTRGDEFKFKRLYKYLKIGWKLLDHRHKNMNNIKI